VPQLNWARRGALFAHPLLGCALCRSYEAVIVSVIFLLVISQVAHAQGFDNRIPVAEVQSHVVRLPVIDGNDIQFRRIVGFQRLSQTRVSTIVQDDRGFLWFATQYGLDRYDGYRFKVFKHESAKANGPSGVYIRALYKDRDGNLWVGSGQSLDRFDPITEIFAHFHLNQGDLERNTSLTIRSITQDHRGLMWLSTVRGLYSLDPQTGRTKRYLHNPDDPTSLSSNDIKFSGLDREGSFWVATSAGLDRFDLRSGKVNLHVPVEGQEREFSFFEDSFGVFWIIHASGGGGIDVLDRKKNQLTHYVLSEPRGDGEILSGVHAMLEDRNHDLWLATAGWGLLKYERERRRFVRYSHSTTDPESLADDQVISLFEDREGTIWTGFHEMVPGFFSTKPPLFDKFAREPGTVNELASSLVSAIYEDPTGALWISSAGALNRVDRKQRKNTLIFKGNIDKEVHDFLQDRSGTVWAGTYRDGLMILDLKTGALKAVQRASQDAAQMVDSPISRLLTDRSGSLWAATWNGLKRYDPSTHQFQIFKPDPLGNVEYYDIAQDNAGMIWLGGNQGLHLFDPTTHKFTVFRARTDDLAALSDDQVNDVHPEPSDVLWLGTQNGLDRFDTKTKRFKTYYEQNGLSGNVVNCILDDDHGYLWMSTNRGISKFDPRTERFKNYSVADGLPGPDLTGWGACYKSKDGEMFFGGFSGATAFFPDKVIDDPSAPPIALTELRISGDTIEPGPSSLLKRSITYTDSVVLTSSQNNFMIEFSALSFFNSMANRYRYRLIGLENEWHDVGSDQRSVSYTTLPAGRYTFQVQGATSRGNWSNPGGLLEIEILPPWWNTLWFRAMCCSAFLFCIWGLYRYRLNQIAMQYNIRIEERVGERTRIARELHDTLLQSFYGLVLQFQALKYHIPADSRAGEMLHEVLSQSDEVLAEGRERVIGLRTSTAETNDLGDALSLVGNSLKRAVGTTFSVVVRGDKRPLHPIVRDEVYRIGRESIVNAFHHSAGKRIEVEILYQRSGLKLRVRDDGLGIDDSILERGARLGHFGLPGMKERAQKIGASLDIWSGPSMGTEIEVEVPAKIAFRQEVKVSRWQSFRKWLDDVN
jgi:ligand-binding sensor domain-containing protein/signal transduction histidine kinase